MFNYLCEDCQVGTVHKTVKKNYTVNLFDKPIIIPEAIIGLCDNCGTRNYHGKEMHRWKEIYENEITNSETLTDKLRDDTRQ